MKNDFTEILDFEIDSKPKVGRPKLADKKLKKKSLIIATLSFLFVVLLLIFGYGTLFGFRNLNLKGNVINKENKTFVKIDEIKPLVKEISLKEGTARKLYLTILPASASNKNIKYTSSDKDVAIVDNNGKVTALSVGNAFITAKTTDGSNLATTFSVSVTKNVSGSCSFTTLVKEDETIKYETSCENAKIKEIQYKFGNDSYNKLLTKKEADEIKFSKEQLKKDVTLKIIYYPNNSKITKYETKTLKAQKKTTTSPKGYCDLTIKEVKASSAKYDVTCNNASVTKIAYKIGTGSYVGIETSSLADTVLFEESDVTRIIYFSIDYNIDGTNKMNTVTKSSIIEKGNTVAEENNNNNNAE